MTDRAVIWTALAAAAATLSALFAALYTWLTYRLVRSQTDPNVIVYTKHDDSRPSILMIVIENVGRGLASDVRFKFSRSVPADAWGIEEGSAKEAPPMTDGPLIAGIPSFGPGDTRRITWGQYGGLRKALGGKPIEVICEFNNGRRKMRATSSMLEVESFEGTDASSSEGLRLIEEVGKVRQQLENIAKAIKAKT